MKKLKNKIKLSKTQKEFIKRRVREHMKEELAKSHITRLGELYESENGEDNG